MAKPTMPTTSKPGMFSTSSFVSGLAYVAG